MSLENNVQNNNGSLVKQVEVLQLQLTKLTNVGREFYDHTQECSLNSNTREACIIGLKEKIVELQEDNHRLQQEGLKHKKAVDEKQNVLDTVYKSNEWYKRQWETKESENRALKSQLVTLQGMSKVINENKKDNTVVQSTKPLQEEYAKLQQLKEEIISHQKCVTVVSVLPEDTSVIEFYKTQIESLNKDILSVKETCLMQANLIQQLLREQQEDINCIQQKEIQDRQFNLNKFETVGHKIQTLTNSYENTIFAKDKQILQLTTQLSNYQLELAAAEKQRTQIRKAINHLQYNFQKLLSKHEEVKGELKMKETLLEEQQHMNFIDENKINALNKYEVNGSYAAKILENEIKKFKDIVYLKDLSLDEIKKRYESYNRVLLKKVKELLHEKKRVNKENSSLKEKQCILIENINSLELELDQHKHEVETSKMRLETVQKLRSVTQSNTKEEELKVFELNKEITQLKDNLTQMISNHSHCVNDIESIKAENIRLIKGLNALRNDKAFLNRLVLDLKRVVNTKTCLMNEHNNNECGLHIFDLNKFTPPPVNDDFEIRLLIERMSEIRPTINLRDCIHTLKSEVSAIQKAIYTNVY